MEAGGDIVHLNVLNQALNVLQTLSFGGISVTYTENNVELKMTVTLFGLTVIPSLHIRVESKSGAATLTHF